MIVFPNCKVNIGLQVTGKRSDKFHDIETVFFPVPITDALEIIENKNSDEVTLTTSGIMIPGPEKSNSCLKAYWLLKNIFPSLPAVHIHLHKKIPAGGGLGGGSSDASFMLQLLNKKYQLGLTKIELSDLSLQLGSDCPFFIYNEPCLARGRGEKISPLNIDLSFYKWVIVHPGIHINTAWAFSILKLNTEKWSLEKSIQQPIENWKNSIHNEFEEPIFENYPEIKKIRDKLYEFGAIYASLSGSGSSVYGLFYNKKEINIPFPDHYFIKII